MKLFWEVVNHQDAVQVKFEIAKGLARFTQANTSDLKDKKYRMLEENSRNSMK